MIDDPAFYALAIPAVVMMGLAKGGFSGVGAVSMPLLAMAVSLARLGEISGWLFANHPMAPPPPPDGYTWSLPLLYLVWAIALVPLYIACRWYADLKSRRRDWWLKFV